MRKQLSILTCEAVGIGHPDKICDQIADTVVTRLLAKDPYAHVACEVFASNHLIVIGGEIGTSSYVDVVKAAWDILLPLGYTYSDFTILSNINKQSAEIAQQVDRTNKKLGAGDIGVAFGYATNETKDLLPLPYILATKFIHKINELTKKGVLKYTNYDSKSQVTVRYENNKPVAIETVIVSLQHFKQANIKALRDQIKRVVLDPIAKEYKMKTNFVFELNKNGSFISGGPFADTGLTGRKLMVDTYGSLGRHGGGAFSGKDYTKVDRTGAYYARYIAKNLVKAGVADKIEIQFSFNIGSEEPVSMDINTFNTEKIPLAKIYQIVYKLFKFKLKDIVEELNLRSVNYLDTAVYGHFTTLRGTKPWERLDKVEKIKKLMK